LNKQSLCLITSQAFGLTAEQVEGKFGLTAEQVEGNLGIFLVTLLNQG
jgi:hypothetical protein